jgi:hypothetical protein
MFLDEGESVQLTFLRHLRTPRPWRDERGIVLAVVLLVMVLLLGMGLTSLFSGYTNLLTSTNLKLATAARNTTEAGINEAIYRLSRQEGQPGAIAPDLSNAFWNNPNWQVEIDLTAGDSNYSDGVVSTIQAGGDLPGHIPDHPVLMRYKKPDPTGAPNNVLFYDHTLNPPFRTITLPAASGAIPDTARPVIQILATGLNERDAERQVLAETTSTVTFAPPAPLSSGVDVNLNGTSFIDGVNHHHDIDLTGNNPYGDEANETTDNNTLQDSSDDSNIDPSTGPGPKPCGAGGNHGRANPYLTDQGLADYTSCARLYNRWTKSTGNQPAWVGLQWITSADSHGGTSHWHGVNQEFAAAIAFSSAPTVTNDNTPPTVPWSRGVFTWRNNNALTSLTGTIPAPSTVTLCSNSPVNPPPLTCRPAILATFPTFQQFMGLDDVSFQKLLDKPDTCGGTQAACGNVLSASVPPLGFTYIKMSSLSDEFVYDGTFAAPSTNDFGLIYVDGSLRINGNQKFKGLIFIEGSLTIVGQPTILGAIMVRGATNVTFGAGNMTLLYSRKAAELGIQAGHPWRILTWEDTAIQGSTYTQ